MPTDAHRLILPHAALGSYLRYAYVAALRAGRVDGTLSEWPRLASSVAEPHAVSGNARTIYSTMPKWRLLSGRVPGDRQRTIFLPGPSQTTGQSASRSRPPRWMYLRHGSAMSSTSCSGRANDVRSSLP